MTPPPPHSGAPPAKKGLPPLAWAGIGCGGLALLAMVAGGLLVGTCARKGIQIASQIAANPGKTAAEAMATQHPGIERISDDDTSGQMTLRLKDSGETVTLGYAEIGQGKIPFKDAAGNPLPAGPGDLAKIPAWVPRYPGVADESAIFHEDGPTRILGIVTATTSDDIDSVSRHFEGEAIKLSLDLSGRTSMDLNGNRSLKLTFRGGKRELVMIAFGKAGEPLVIQTTYQETK